MTPSSHRTSLIALLLAAGLNLPAAAHAATPAPTVSTAPGRIVFPVDGPSVLRTDSGSGATLATALPDGSSLMFGSGAAGQGVEYAAKIGPSGALDPSFGTNGVARLDVPFGAASDLTQVLRRSDGKLLLVSSVLPSTPRTPYQFQVTRLNADMTLDRAYGVDGTASTAIGAACGCGSAALQPDGAIVVTGTTGLLPQPGGEHDFHWAVARLTPAGAIDPSFGSGGIATVPAAGSTRGFAVALGAGGTIVATAQSQVGTRSTTLLTRLTSSGAPDPTFAGGTPVDVAMAPGVDMLVQDDGSVVLDGQPQGSDASLSTPTHQLLARFTPAGAPDPGFGSNGIADLGTQVIPRQLLPGPGRSVLLAGTPSTPGPTVRQRLNVRLVAADGTVDPSLGGPHGTDVDLPFGGGESSIIVSVRPRPVSSILQNSFRFQASDGTSHLVRRADGSYLVAGSVTVIQPTSEGAGNSIGRFAATALTPTFGIDASFGARAARPRLTARLSLQRAATAHTRHGVRVELKASEVGLAHVKITHAGRAIANSLVPVLQTTRETLPVELTSYGNSYLRQHRDVRVAITATTRDLLANTAMATAQGRLR